MVTFKSSYGYGRKRTYYSKGSSSTVKRAKGNFKASKAGRDSLSFVINSNSVFSARYDSDKEEGTACVNVWDILCRNTHFKSLQDMYDQVKIDGIKVKLSITDAQTTINSISSIKNYTVYTAWDRTGLGTTQVRFFDENNEEIYSSDFDEKKVATIKTAIGRGIVNSSQQNKTVLNSFERWNSNLSLYPSLNNELGQYVSTGDIRRFLSGINSNSSEMKVSKVYKDSTVNEIINSNNPVIFFENPSVRFKPCLLVGVFSNAIDSSGNITQYGNVSPVIFNGEWNISVTFRNLKGSVASLVSFNEEEEISNEIESNRVVMNITDDIFDKLDKVDRYKVLNVKNLINDEVVVFNQNERNYGTDIQIRFPNKSELTPMDVDGAELEQRQYNSETGDFVLVSAEYLTFVEGVFEQFGVLNSTGSMENVINNVVKENKYFNFRKGKEIQIYEMKIPAKSIGIIFKISNRKESGYEFGSVYNSKDETIKLRIEMPNDILKLRGVKDWLKRIYNGAMYVTKALSVVPGPIGAVSAALNVIGTEGAKIYSTVIDVIDLLSVKEKKILIKNGMKDRSILLFDNNLEEEEDESTLYELPDEYCTGIDSELLEPLYEEN